MYCVTSCWTCPRISSSGSFSSADRLISSINRRCSRTLASSSLSLSRELACVCAAIAVWSGGSGNTTPGSASRPSAGTSGAGVGSAAAVRRAVKRPIILVPRSSFPQSLRLSSGGGSACPRSACPRSARPRQLEFSGALVVGGFGRGRRLNELAKLLGDPIPRLDLVERDAAVHRLAHDRVVVGDAAGECVAEHLLDIRLAQTGGEHLVLVAVHNHLRLRAVAEPLAD